MKNIFIAGTDTGVGKTYVTALLKKYYLEQGLRCVTHKWIQSGCLEDDDLAVHRDVAGLCEGELDDVCVSYKFEHPSSPHLAASLENVTIDPQKIIDDNKTLTEKYDIVISEGSGGLLVPYDDKNTLIDIVKQLDLEVLLIAGNKLGAVNHTLLSVEYLKYNNINIKGIIFNDLSNNMDETIRLDNPHIVEKLSGVEILAHLEYGASQIQI